MKILFTIKITYYLLCAISLHNMYHIPYRLHKEVEEPRFSLKPCFAATVLKI